MDYFCAIGSFKWTTAADSSSLQALTDGEEAGRAAGPISPSFGGRRPRNQMSKERCDSGVETQRCWLFGPTQLRYVYFYLCSSFSTAAVHSVFCSYSLPAESLAALLRRRVSIEGRWSIQSLQPRCCRRKEEKQPWKCSAHRNQENPVPGSAGTEANGLLHKWNTVYMNIKNIYF